MNRDPAGSDPVRVRCSRDPAGSYWCVSRARQQGYSGLLSTSEGRHKCRTGENSFGSFSSPELRSWVDRRRESRGEVKEEHYRCGIGEMGVLLDEPKYPVIDRCPSAGTTLSNFNFSDYLKITALTAGSLPVAHDSSVTHDCLNMEHSHSILLIALSLHLY